MRLAAHMQHRNGGINEGLFASDKTMLLIANETSKRTRTLVDVARELSLTLTYFKSTATLAELLDGQSRRIVILTEPDIAPAVVKRICEKGGKGQFGVIIAGDSKGLRSSDKAELINKLVESANLQWVTPKYNFDQLSTATRGCRRRMLRLSREDLESAIENTEFLLRYQPKVQRGSDTAWETCEAEALLRWRHPIHGLIGPLEFLPEAEAFGLMGAISEYVLHDAAGQLVKWRNQGLSLDICVNLASSLLSDETLPDQYEAIIKRFGLECSNFAFEITEQELTDPEAPHLKTLAAFRAKGFRLCLDDFRVAAVSLGTFDQLPFDEIKIHASALKRAQDDPVALKVLAAITGLAHNLGMSVCAEGVEDQATFEFLKTIECDKMQGYLISEAVMPDIIRKVYDTSKKSIVNVA
jgi:EAL domain-containing protein (putative c-di-GMP-specific phosphodiesterase class I)